MRQSPKTSVYDDAWSGAVLNVAATLECLPEPAIIVGPDQKIKYVNPLTESFLGYACDELIEEPLDFLVPERYREQYAEHVRCFFEKLVVRPMGSSLEVLIRSKGGEEIPVDIALGPIDVGSETQVIATIRDQTEQRRVLKTLEDSEERYRSYVENSSEGFWQLVFDDPILLDLPELEQVERLLRDSYFTGMNLTFSQLYGYAEPGAMNGVHLEDFLPRDDPATVPTLLKVVRARYRLRSLVSFERDRYGNEIVFENSFIGDIEDGEVRSIRGTKRDITEQYQAKREQQTMGAAIESMIDGCVVVDATVDDLPVIYANERFSLLTGYAKEEIMAKNCRFLQGPNTDPAVVKKIRESIRRKVGFEGEILNYRKDGTPFWNRLHIAPVKSRLGDVIRFVGSIHDLTAERQSLQELNDLKQALTHVSRVATLGELTAALAHEVNQPLTAIAANVCAGRRLLKSNKPDLQEINNIFEDIAMDDKRAADVVRGLRKLLSNKETDKERVHINEITKKTLELMNADLIVKQVSVTQNLACELPAITCDRVQIQQVMLNLILNASEAVESLALARRRIEVKTSYDLELGVSFAVRDYGDGIAEEYKERLFEPFFTIKQFGLGMGLAVSRTIIEAHGGEIRADNNADEGATVSFTLPLPNTEGP